jgi:hypothetical protein
VPDNQVVMKNERNGSIKVILFAPKINKIRLVDIGSTKRIFVDEKQPLTAFNLVVRSSNQYYMALIRAKRWLFVLRFAVFSNFPYLSAPLRRPPKCHLKSYNNNAKRPNPP